MSERVPLSKVHPADGFLFNKHSWLNFGYELHCHFMPPAYEAPKLGVLSFRLPE